MRTELTLLEKIDLYSSGKLTGADLTSFEEQLASDEVLRGQVEMQKELVRAINRKALRAQISAVAAGGAGGGGFSNFAIGIVSAVSIGGIILTGLFLNGNFDNSVNETDLDETEVPVRIVNNYEAMPEAANFKVYAEEPETIFSSHKQYEDQSTTNGDMNVTVRFRSRGEGIKLEPLNTVEPDITQTEVDPIKPDKEDKAELAINYKNYSRKASYPGGNVAMKKFIDKNLHYPQSAIEKSIECVIRCEFHVTEDGLISEIKAECIKMADRDGEAYNDVKLLMNRRIMNAFIGNATHILRTMPTWEPAKNAQGNTILSVQRMYFNYDLERGCLVYQLDED